MIAAVHVESWRSTYRGIVPDEFLDELSVTDRAARRERMIARAHLDGHYIYVAEDDQGRVVGFADGGAERSRDSGFDGEIYAIYLLKEHQRRGLGRALFHAVVDRLAAAGYRSLLVWVLADNPSRGFYERLGGMQVHRKTITIGGAPLEEVAYGWSDIHTVR